jgi:hypothetical protein
VRKLIDLYLSLRGRYLARRDTIAGLRLELAAVKQIADQERRRLEGEVEILNKAIETLTYVIERDRARVQAEAAKFIASRELAVSRPDMVANQ